MHRGRKPLVVFLNGPAGCGKDAIANILCKKNGWAHLKFSGPLKSALACLLPFKPDFDSQDGKKIPVGPSNISVRGALIQLSELYAKPVLGMDIFGRLLIRELESTKEEVVVVSDSRFGEEVVPVIEAGYVAILFRINRRGYVWEGDSGGYQYPVHFPSFDLDNDGLPAAAAFMAERICSMYTSQSPRP